MKLKNCILYVAAGLLLAACSSAPQLDSPEAFEEVISTVNDKVDKKYEIVRILVYESDKLSNKRGTILVQMYHEGKRYSLSITQDAEPKLEESKGSYNGDASKIKGIDLSKLSKDNYRKYVEQAVEIFGEATGDVEYVYKGVGSFIIENNGKGDDVTYDIDINFTEKDGATRYQGRNIITDYYEVGFRVDKDGNVEMKE